ncbi:MAG: 50S ribosomal protein L21 [Actinomycetota bacterium]|jgi:large subunit ribosomal protein L21|nr:50S ribosomal protein L21 [Actinomycetota bacterium]
MYAVIRTGGRQERVVEGQKVRVDARKEAVGSEVRFEPLLVIGDGTVLATPDDLARASVVGKVVGVEAGPKINAMTYKPKSNQRRRWGHRQWYTTVEITSIVTG